MSEINLSKLVLKFNGLKMASAIHHTDCLELITNKGTLRIDNHIFLLRENEAVSIMCDMVTNMVHDYDLGTALLLDAQTERGSCPPKESQKDGHEGQ